MVVVEVVVPLQGYGMSVTSSMAISLLYERPRMARMTT